MYERIQFAPGFLALFLLLFAGCAGSNATKDPVASEGEPASVTPAEVPETVPVHEPLRPAPVQRVDPAMARAGRFDQGKMWTFDHPPVDYFAETYGFTPDEEWFRHARLGTLRIPGCTASFVSPTGLVLTNHHCARSHAVSVALEGESILDDGFYARSLDEERLVDGMWADQLVGIGDITPAVEAAIAGIRNDAEREQMRQEVIKEVQEGIETEAGPGHHVEIVSIYNGALLSAYVFRRYTDLRLVLIPELKIGFFGGDPDNFTYPRYTLDIALLRVYENDKPLEVSYYFPMNSKGVKEGDPVFVIGNPGSTFRLSTVAELTFRRDVQEPALLDLIEIRLAALEALLDETPAEEQDALINRIFSLQNARKLYTGRVKALNDPVVTARRMDAEEQFMTAIGQTPALSEQYGDLIERMREVQEEKRAYGDAFRAFLALNPASSLGAAALRRALVVHEYAGLVDAAQDIPDDVYEQLVLIEDQPAALQAAYLAVRFQTWSDRFGQDSTFVVDIFGERSPEEAARHVVEHSMLTEGAAAMEALQTGSITETDPAIQVVGAIAGKLTAYRSAMAALAVEEQALAQQIGRARYAVYGVDVPPDATFSLRIADGVVQGYPYNGTVAPPYTTYYGLYDHYYSYGADTPWDVPARWLTPPGSFEMRTPLNFVSTNDTIGGNSGSPVIDPDLRLAGLLFDGNIESLSGDFIYLTDRARSISVDARGILEALDDMYDADRLVLETTSGRFAESEEEADAILSE
ncbi:MAG: S46 family peptidase [Bacteroidetes bacterium SB0662_bin_6]|nr:S46 family peptidase [Bacteroidetes bacterium SB0668_bin_1]MYE03917.1 S46 family peptidase [Bacteroidetes bacterium SB0662_bin_6]